MYAPLQHRPNTIQPKLEIGQPNDQYEQEADAVADQVVSGSAAPPVQMKTSDESKKLQASFISGMQASPYRQVQMKGMKEEEEKVQMQGMEEDKVQMKCTECEEEEKVQKKPAIQMDADGTAQASPELAGRLSSSKGKGKALRDGVQKDIGGKMGADLSDVKIHTDADAVQMNTDLGARAFTNGRDIYFNEGQYNPGSKEGKHLLAHELTHTVQQTGGEMIQRQEDPKLKRCQEVRSKFFKPMVEKYANMIKEMSYTHVIGTPKKPYNEFVKALRSELGGPFRMEACCMYVWQVRWTRHDFDGTRYATEKDFLVPEDITTEVPSLDLGPDLGPELDLNKGEEEDNSATTTIKEPNPIMRDLFDDYASMGDMVATHDDPDTGVTFDFDIGIRLNDPKCKT